MRKILGIILSALMLMTTSAFAEETAMNAELAFVTGAVNLTDTDDFNVVYSVYNKSITNRVTATAVYTLSDENGNVIWNGGDEVIIPAGSTKKFEFAGNVSKYGVHTLNVLLTDKNSGAVLRGEKEISLSKSNTGRNEYSGVSAHFAWSSNPNSTIPLLGKMGSKYVRDEIYWKDYELEKGKVLDLKAVVKNECNDEIIDARHEDRYNGKVDEPRKSLRVGHVEGAKCVFFKHLLNEQGEYLDKDKLEEVFKSKGVDLNKSVIAYCGTGLTACIDLFAIALIGKADKCKLYDASWAEYGNTSLEDIEKIKKE